MNSLKLSYTYDFRNWPLYNYNYTLNYDGRQLTGTHTEPYFLPSLPIDAILRGLQGQCKEGDEGAIKDCKAFFGGDYDDFLKMEFDE